MIKISHTATHTLTLVKNTQSCTIIYGALSKRFIIYITDDITLGPFVYHHGHAFSNFFGNDYQTKLNLSENSWHKKEKKYR